MAFTAKGGMNQQPSERRAQQQSSMGLSSWLVAATCMRQTGLTAPGKSQMAAQNGAQTELTWPKLLDLTYINVIEG
jgi:hypothetical protein